MVDQSRRDRVGLGLIGLGPSWEQLYRQAIEHLHKRLTIRLVYDPVEARARTVASEFSAEFAGSLYQILNRPDLQGFLVLDPGWLGSGALNLIARSRRPVYLASPVLRQVHVLRRALHRHPNRQTNLNDSSFADDRWMPELGLRFTPASCRLRELIATKLGPVKDVHIECNLFSDSTDVAHVIDWCADLMGHPPVIRNLSNPTSESDRQFRFEFSRPKSKDAPRNVSILHANDAAGLLRCKVHCERGIARLQNRTTITWQNSHDAAEECLSDERSEIEILIDQFCRRALGGLNPVGRLSEFLRAMEIAELIGQSDHPHTP